MADEEHKNSFCLAPELLTRISDRYHTVYSETLADAPEAQKQLYPAQPTTEREIGTLIEVAFWASLLKEEGRHHSFQLQYSPPVPDYLGDSFVFGERLAFTPEKLAKLAPAVNAQDMVIGVSQDQNGKLGIWGFGTPSVHALLITCLDPGQLIVEFQGYPNLSELEKPSSFSALVTGSRMEFIDRHAGVFGIKLIHSRFPGSTDDWQLIESAVFRSHDLSDIARFMRSHGHGGILLLVEDDQDWTESIIKPMLYSYEIGKPYEKIKDVIAAKWKASMERQSLSFEPAYWDIEGPKRALQQLGQLTAVDGATVVTYALDVLTFGAKITPKNSSKPIEQVLVSEPFEGSSHEEKFTSDLGGTRHQFAAQFVYDQQRSVAVVASQDGRLSVLAWHPGMQMVAVTLHAEFTLL
jgi:hypothetical protein